MPRAKKIIEETVLGSEPSLQTQPLNPAYPIPVPQAVPVQMKPVVPKQNIILKNTSGEDMKIEDYFYNGKVPPAFNATVGKPVDREDLVEIFNSVFDPQYDFLFYKTLDKEVYVVIVPLKNSLSVGKENESLDGDFQKHAISFISEGSVNGDTLKAKLRRILGFCKFGDK